MELSKDVFENSMFQNYGIPNFFLNICCQRILVAPENRLKMDWKEIDNFKISSAVSSEYVFENFRFQNYGILEIFLKVFAGRKFM